MPPCPCCGRDEPLHARGLCITCYQHEHQKRPGCRWQAPDPIVIERACTGHYLGPINPQERAEIITILTHRGYSAHQIADRVRCAPRSVTRYRSRLRTAA